MTVRILQIDSSIFGENGQSSQLARYLVAQIQAKQPVELVHRDLAAKPLPHLNIETLQALMATPEQRTTDQTAIVTIADTLISELVNADVLVLAAPMYNFGVPSALKAWMDYVARAGVTFRYTPNGPEGLLDKRKKVYVLSSRGGIHKGKDSDSQTAFVNTFLGFLGLTDIHWIYAEGINMSDKKDAALANAKTTIDDYIAQS